RSASCEAASAEASRLPASKRVAVWSRARLCLWRLPCVEENRKKAGDGGSLESAGDFRKLQCNMRGSPLPSEWSPMRKFLLGLVLSLMPVTTLAQEDAAHAPAPTQKPKAKKAK